MLIAPAPPHLDITEAQFQRLVEELAQWWAWRTFHDNDSRKNDRGLPDLIMVRPPRLIFAELKVGRGRMRTDQHRWARDLMRCHGNVEYHLWKPGDWFAILQSLAPEEHEVIETGRYTIPRVPFTPPIVPEKPRAVRAGPKHRRKPRATP